MVKRITVTLGEHIFNRMFLNFEGNRSRRTEHLLLLGLESEIGDPDRIKAQLSKFNEVIVRQRLEINKLNADIGRLRKNLDLSKSRYNPGEVIA